MAASEIAKRLVGAWKSNKDETLDYLRAHSTIPTRRYPKLIRILGRRISQFDGLLLRIGDGKRWSDGMKYEVIRRSTSILALCVFHPLIESHEWCEVEFVEDDGIWVTPHEWIYADKFHNSW